jgi:APA family basic amino acid/polyamine antiporter
VPADKVENPTVNVPRATLYGTLAIALLSLLACSIVQVLIPADQLAQSDAPFAVVIQRLLGDGAGIAVAVFAAISGLGCLNGWTLLQAELPAAMARSGVFPPLFATVSARNVPVFGLVFTSALASVLVLANSNRTLASLYTFMILVSTSATLVLYLAVALAAIRLQRAGRVRPAAAGAGILLACGALGALYSIWALAGAGAEAFWWCMALLAAGAPVFWFQRRQSRARTEAAAATPAA